jgi:hypothetical protein
MPVTDIHEIRLLPPLAVGRFGSSDEPMHNYDVLPPRDANGTGFHVLQPAETLVVHPQDGSIVRAVTPPEVKFRDGAGGIKPVAPFLEVWARYTADGPFEPPTLTALNDLQLGPADVHWTVRVGNLKMFRRTGDVRDRITAEILPDQLAGHSRQELRGRAPNFRPNRTITLGWIQYIRPTTAFPEIRLRFTPGRGLVYGHTASDVISSERAIYDPVAGRWDTHSDMVMPTSPTPRARLFTSPGGIYAQTRPAPGQRRANLGYFDDSCDGVVQVTLRVSGRELTSLARIGSGPPDFAPDSFPIRSLADDLEQMLLGSEVAEVTGEQVIDFVRRAMETMRLMNTETQNREFPFWVPEAQEAFGPGGARYLPTLALHQGLLQALQGFLAQADSPQRQQAIAALEAILRILRTPEKTADYSLQAPAGERPGMQRMPALMRSSDGDLLALTRRQQNLLRKAVDQFQPAPSGENTPRAAMIRMIRHHQFAATLHSTFSLPGDGTLADLFARPEELLDYLAAPTSVTRGSVAVQLGLSGQRLVTPKDPTGSTFFTLISNVAHPMNSVLSLYQDPVLQIDGIEVVRQWILSL